MSNSHRPVQDLIRARFSPRAFAARAVGSELLASLLEAARWAPSCYNDQPWRFLVTTADRPAAFRRLFDCLVPGNQAWAASAPVLMLAVARLQFRHDGTPNRHAIYDLGQAVGTLLVQATALGLHAHQMAGFDAERARSAFAIPPANEPLAVIALGHLGDASRLPPGMEEKNPAARERLAIAEFAYRDAWGEPFVGF